MNRAEVRKKYKEKNKDKQENNSESNEEKPYIRKKDREKKEEVNGSEQNPILRRRERILGKVKQEEKTEVTYGTKSFKSKNRFFGKSTPEDNNDNNDNINYQTKSYKIRYKKFGKESNEPDDNNKVEEKNVKIKYDKEENLDESEGKHFYKKRSSNINDNNVKGFNEDNNNKKILKKHKSEAYFKPNEKIKILKIEKEENINEFIDDEFSDSYKKKPKQKYYKEEPIYSPEISQIEKTENFNDDRIDYLDKQYDYIVYPNDEIELLGEERPEDVIVPIDEIEILGKERPYDVIEPIDEIQILGRVRPDEVIEPIDEIQILGRTRVDNVIEPLDEIQIAAKKRPDNIIYPNDEIELLGKRRHDNNVSMSDTLLDFNTKNEQKLKYSMLFNEYNSTPMYGYDENKNRKIKEIIELKQQVENERTKIKDLLKKIIQLENELNDYKD